MEVKLVVTLVINIHNSGSTIAEVLQTWFETCADLTQLEILAVCDGCTDDSVGECNRWSAEHPGVDMKVLHTPDVWEIKANNAALKRASGEIIIFAQDDNTMHTFGWDQIVCDIFEKPCVGAVGLLAGLRFTSPLAYLRVEAYTPHKGDTWIAECSADARYVHVVDAINRPFAVRTAELRSFGGLCEDYCPLEWDDADLCMVLRKLGYHILYAPLDCVNSTRRMKTLGPGRMDDDFKRGKAIFQARHIPYLNGPCFHSAFGFWGALRNVNSLYNVQAI